MDSAADDIIAAMVQAGFGVYGTDIFKGSKAKIPSGDGPYTSVIDTGGTAPLGTHNSAGIGVPAYTRPSFQLLFRARNYVDAEARAKAVWELFYRLGSRSQLINGCWWVSITVIQNPFDLQPDEVGRPRIAFNIDAEKRLSAATS